MTQKGFTVQNMISGDDESGNNNAGVIADIAYADPDLLGVVLDFKRNSTIRGQGK